VFIFLFSWPFEICGDWVVFFVWWLFERELCDSDRGIKDNALSCMARHGDTCDLHLLLDELLTLGGKTAFYRRQIKNKRKTQSETKSTAQSETARDIQSNHKHVITIPTTSQKRNRTRFLPEYGFGDMERNACGYLCIAELSAIVRDLQERHENEGRFKRSKQFADFLMRSCEIPNMSRPDVNRNLLEKCGSPTNEIALLNYNYWEDTKRTLLPPNDAVVLTSIATAGSGEEGEWNVWFDLFHRKYRKLTFATVLDSGVTGRNKHKPTEGATLVKYNQYARKETWPGLSDRLFQEMMKGTRVKGNDFAAADWIFHWGCISHYETPVADSEETVEGWGRHEHWNMLMCIAMARHALECLKTGGNLVLKVRMFEATETLGLVAVLSCAFREVRLYPNYRMQAEFVSVVCEGFLGKEGDIVILVKEILKNSTSYKVFDIFDARIVGNAVFQKTMERAYEVREEMRRDHDRVTYVMMHIMYLISKDISFEDKDLDWMLVALEQDLPFKIDENWRSGIIKQVRDLQETLKDVKRTKDRNKLANFVEDFDLVKFR